VTAHRERFEERTSEICERRRWKWDGQHVDMDLAGGRRQQVQLDYFVHDEHEMVRLYSLIGSTKRIRPDRLAYALALNFRMPHGSMAVHDDMLVVVDTLMLADADTGEIESTIAYLAETADQYEKSMFGPDAH